MKKRSTKPRSHAREPSQAFIMVCVCVWVCVKSVWSEREEKEKKRRGQKRKKQRERKKRAVPIYIISAVDTGNSLTDFRYFHHRSVRLPFSLDFAGMLDFLYNTQGCLLTPFNSYYIHTSLDLRLVCMYYSYLTCDTLVDLSSHATGWTRTSIVLHTRIFSLIPYCLGGETSHKQIKYHFIIPPRFVYISLKSIFFF
ncbi:hypothetical protein BDB00DRAFT_96064 [Zychaea mexicana]|uniref:uncharacterized protein n=1 Tax=Zychaea mexicana TaxID=64656 RepID=UPI0022FE0CAF|nr:uncharacterized protein BDB00DRAFT_96064 [Zychaea mexicana]KAI9484962.1 hypothetical protein BDB00DRAFT_96064 [Zychaea mexicana]